MGMNPAHVPDDTLLAARMRIKPTRRNLQPPLPDPLVCCDRCGEHAAMGKIDLIFICGHCAPAVSIFSLPLSGNSLEAQRLADEALDRYGDDRG